MYFGDFGSSASALRISAAAFPRFASRTSTSGQSRSCSSDLATIAGRRSIRICRRSKDLGDRWTRRSPSCSSSRVSESNRNGPKWTLMAKLRNGYGFPATWAGTPLHNSGMPPAAKAPTGLSIWHAMREELMLNLYPLPYTTLPPTIFYVYLHPADFDRLRGILPLLLARLHPPRTAHPRQVN